MYRQSNKQASGNFAHLNGKQVTWEENYAYEGSAKWTPASGKIIRVASNGDAYYVENAESGARHWLGGSWGQYRNIVVA